ncbi:hypothetical protein [Anaerotignum sp.]|uniref:hypothetical protein n=1 Tax=Anaerotignum sp. TaxID=2039241 RepID=UPI0028AA353B|nr:hypothetical protein [Anaerotignum sp.]
MKGSRKVSILQGKEKICYLTGRDYDLRKHHIYFGVGMKDISDKHGFWVYLIPEHHNASNEAVHCKNGHKLDLRLKRECQAAFEKDHTREEFMKIVGRNYLD